MRIVFAGGGTAGHINPALAIAGYVREREPDAEILYIGAKGGMEERLVPAAGFPFRGIVVSGFQRKPSWDNLKRNAKTVVRMFTSSGEAKHILREFTPDLCVGTGGYVSGPVVREAVRLGIPSVIHEQNAFPGVTTKVLAKRVQRVMLAVEDARRYLDPGARCALTGNPVRQEVLRAQREPARRALGLDSRPMILSFGGSLGARTLNEAMASVLAEEAKTGEFQFIHGYGRNGAWMPERLAEHGVDAARAPQISLREYINDMPECLAAADLVICRAGAITLSELQAKGKASILIPSPNVAENHQYHNAMALVRRHAAEILEEKDLTGEALRDLLHRVFEAPEEIQILGKNARGMAVEDANERIYRILKETVKQP